MINMLESVPNAFPNLYTKRGALTKREPKKYVCTCGHEFSKTVSIKVGSFIFGQKTCEKCGGKGNDSEAYNVWKRMSNHQIEQEDFILNTVKNKGRIVKEELQTLVNEQFDSKTDALGTLVYFGYLLVDKKKKERWNMIEYRINPEKDLNKRYELIR